MDKTGVAYEDSQWLAEMFEYELCTECGWDADRHTVGPDALGLRHAYCDNPISEELTDAEIETELARRFAL